MSDRGSGRSRLRLVAFAAAAIALGLGGSLVVAERAAARVQDAWLEELAGRSLADPEVHRASTTEGLHYELRPGADESLANSHDWGDQPRRVRIGTHGFRSPERPRDKPAGVLRIACLGGSNTYGAAVSDDGTWPHRLEQELRERGRPVEVWNLGVSGYETLNKVALARTLDEFGFDLFVWQLHNMGPRYVLPDASAAAAARRDPTLVDDWVRLPGNAGFAQDDRFAVIERSRVGGLLRMAVERHEREREGVGAPPDSALLYHWQRGLQALREHLAESDAAHILFVPPAGLQAESSAAREALKTVPVPVVDLTHPGADREPREYGIHPGRMGYLAYTAPLADAIESCLDRPPDCRAR